jgi:hypothetical protein
MDYLLQLLIEQLVAEGIALTSIPAFVRDVSRILATNPPRNLAELNDRLHLLGWEGIDLDGFTLQIGPENAQNRLAWHRWRLHN